MKCIHPNTYEKLGFDTILQKTQEYLHTEEAKNFILSTSPFEDHEALIDELELLDEYANLLKLDYSVPVDPYISIVSFLARIETKGTWLSASELFKILRWLKGISRLHNFAKQNKAESPKLYAWLNTQSFPESVLKKIASIFNERGTIKDNASPELERIRKAIIKTSQGVRSLLNNVMRKAQENDWAIDSGITIRNDRMVIPLKSEAQNKIPGFVQDISQSGGTVFVEPAGALELNNKLRSLQIQEHNELTRIFQEVTSVIRDHLEDLLLLNSVITRLEIIQGKARLAMQLNACLPQINPDGKELELMEAYYPPLVLRAISEKFQVVPLFVKLHAKKRIILISGPNAGGKSIALKTVGLIQLMLQCGFLVPVSPDSSFRLFQSLFIDLGDEQSVENDLSTYTSHLSLMRQMGDKMNHQSLMLIDEFGSGTDPRQGGPIAEAFLERFVRQGAYGIITTHYGNLKDFAELTKGLSNAAMQFDPENMQPTFILQEGIPGRSYAFEIAARVGVHRTILKRAKAKVGQKELDTEKLLGELGKKNQELNRLLKLNQEKERKLNSALSENDKLKEELKQKRKKVVREAQIEAKQMLQDANKTIERTIREIKEKQAEKKATTKARKALQKAMPVIEPEPVATPKDRKQNAEVEFLPREPIELGSWAMLKSSNSFGRVVELKGNRVVVEVNEVRLTVKKNQLLKIKAPAKKQQKKWSAHGFNVVQTRFELDVMGMKVEEAIPEVEKLVDQAILSGLNQLSVLHGKGTGILRDRIRNHLKGIPQVKSLQDAPVDQGGDGWTIILLK